MRTLQTSFYRQPINRGLNLMRMGTCPLWSPLKGAPRARPIPDAKRGFERQPMAAT